MSTNFRKNKPLRRPVNADFETLNVDKQVNNMAHREEEEEKISVIQEFSKL